MPARNLDPINIAGRLSLPQFPQLLSEFLFKYLESWDPPSDMELSQMLPRLHLNLYPSAVATFHAPSDHSGMAGMRRERIRAINSWMGGSARYDTIFIQRTLDATHISTGLEVARVKPFFSVTLRRGLEVHACAFVHHFEISGNEVDEDVGMWTARALFDESSEPLMSVIPLHQILRAAHLIPVYDTEPIPHQFTFAETLDHYSEFYVNKFIDHHAFEIAT